MIVTRIDLLENYESVLPGCKKVCETFAKLQKDGVPEPGSGYKTDTESVFYNVAEYETVAENSKQFEVHEKYADVQILVSGEEVSLYSQELFSGAIDEKTDAALTNANATECTTLVPGIAVIYFPGELHKPSCSTPKGNSKVKKIIFKVEA